MFLLLSVHFQTLKTKQRMLKEDWEFFKQRRFIEEQVHCKNLKLGWQISMCISSPEQFFTLFSL